MPPPNESDPAERQREAAQLVAAEQVSVREDEFRVMHLRVDGQEYHDVRPVRAFPISSKAKYVSFLDEKGKELALLANPQDLDDESRTAVARALEQNYFVPKIVRIESLSETWGVSHWKVETDSGRAAFEVIDRERIRKLPRGRLIIVDADENRYEVDNVEALDARSRSIIQSEI